MFLCVMCFRKNPVSSSTTHCSTAQPACRRIHDFLSQMARVIRRHAHVGHVSDPLEVLEPVGDASAIVKISSSIEEENVVTVARNLNASRPARLRFPLSLNTRAVVHSVVVGARPDVVAIVRNGHIGHVLKPLDLLETILNTCAVVDGTGTCV